VISYTWYEESEGIMKAWFADIFSPSKSIPNRRLIWYAVILFCSLEIIDALITNWAVTAGLVQEGNPLLIQVAGGWSFIILKLIGAGLSGITVLVLHKHFPKLAQATALVISLYYFTVLAWNTGLIVNT
jgi:hypothetical protein